MAVQDTYRTLSALSTGTYREKASKFLALAFPVSGEEEIRQQLQAIRKEYFDANHHCYAWQLGYEQPSFRMNDDGEPSGTAGRPIYGQIQSFHLTDIMVVVVRYFGGTKLGVSGLIQAYKTTARIALEEATIIEKTVHSFYRIIYPYALMNEVMRFCKEKSLTISSSSFDLDCALVVGVRLRDADIIYGELMKKQGLKVEFLHSK